MLGKKVEDIDDEIALLHELKEIVIAFIHQIRQADFTKDSDVNLLYGKAKEIEILLDNVEYAGNPSPSHRLFEVADKLEEKALSRLQIPDNVLKRMLAKVYFIMGDGADVADELGRKYGYFVYHTCDYRHIHSQNADPRYQPELSRDVPDFYSLDPEDALHRELGVVREYTPMVIMDLILLAAMHDRVICENDIDIGSIIHLVTHAVMISNDIGWVGFIEGYEKAIHERDISNDEKDQLIRKLNAVWGGGKPENPRGAAPYGVKQIIRNEHSSFEQIIDEVVGYFGLPRT
ncbi:MAG: hypothetical protein FWH55_14205 [Oscillospiraceae bacterium]|nr:hypothetical protein [Oscillospiraceae bacterium]